MTIESGPRFLELDRKACEELLKRNYVGRLAFTFHDQVDIEPIHYAFADGWVYCRTAAGTKIATLAHHPWVAFEVDEIKDASLFNWQSVVVHGTAYVLEPSGIAEERRHYEKALTHLRHLLPGTLRAQDPVPWRDVVVGIHADRVTGRRAELEPQ
jgi:nitroimidazol reductase NimA-like FMN-containing flavoprotein (pyridoxamine 5'-phosphate oxidase superfamily)